MIRREPLVRVMWNVSETWVEAVKQGRLCLRPPNIVCAKHIPQQQKAVVPERMIGRGTTKPSFLNHSTCRLNGPWTACSGTCRLIFKVFIKAYTFLSFFLFSLGNHLQPDLTRTTSFFPYVLSTKQSFEHFSFVKLNLFPV